MRRFFVETVKRTLGSFGYDIQRAGAARLPDLDPWVREIVERVQPFTMTSVERIAAICESVTYLVENAIEGAIVECGVWQGGSSMAAALALLHHNDRARRLYLFDTFQGMSQPTDVDISFYGQAAKDLLSSSGKATRAWGISPQREVEKNMIMTGYPVDNTICIEGLVQDTMPRTAPDRIALLRLDTDWYDSTKHELTHLFPRLVKRGVLIIDDYGHWLGARKAVDEYFRNHGPRPFLHRIDYTGRIALKD